LDGRKIGKERGKVRKEERKGRKERKERKFCWVDG